MRTAILRQKVICSRALAGLIPDASITTLLRISEALKIRCLLFLRDSVCLAYLFQLDGSFV